MRPTKGFDYDGTFDADNNDFANFMADYGHMFRNNQSVSTPSSSSTSPKHDSSKINGTGKYYPVFTAKRLFKGWLITTLGSVAIIAVLVILALFLG